MITLIFESAKLCAPRPLVPYVPHALCAVVPCALHAVMPHVPCAVHALVLQVCTHVPHILHTLLSNTMISNLY